MRSISFVLACVILLASFAFISAESDSFLSFNWDKKCTKKLNEEKMEENEAESIKQIVEISKELLDRDTKESKAKITPRDAHPRGFGGYAKITIDQDVPKEFQYSLFKNVGKTFDAVVRLSTGNPSTKSDAKSDSRGFAMKVITPEGNHDFVSANYPAFFLKTTKDYIKFFLGARQGLIGILKFFMLNGKFKELLAVRKFTGQEMGNPLLSKYFSATPYSINGRAIKFSFQPVDCKTGASVEDVKPGKQDRFLRKRMFESLSQKSLCYDMLIQKQEDACEQPIENPMVIWETPFKKVARIEFPMQQDHGVEADKFFENLSFTPWRFLPGWKPLSSINRARKVVYEELSKYRHGKNGEPRVEPTEVPAFLKN